MTKSINMERIKDFDGLNDESGDPLLSSILSLYLEVAPKILANMQSHVESHKIEEIHREAHSLKSSSANVGAMNLFQLCADLEKKTSTGGDVPGPILKTAMAQISAEYLKVKGELRLIIDLQAPATHLKMRR